MPPLSVIMFEQGLTIARVRGIPVRLHLSLLLFLPFLAFIATRQFTFLASTLGVAPDELGLSPPIWGVLLAVALFVAVLAHELSHSIVAVRGGARVRAITLMMLGGVSLIEGDLPPRKEAWMAFVGPLASFVIAAVSYLLYRFAPLPLGLAVALLSFALANALLAVFNLLPAFPMDGGRIVRGLLAGRLGVDRATVIAARIGQGMAIVFAAWAVVSFNVILLLIAWFVWSGAAAERQHVAMVGALRGLVVEDFMSDRLGDAYPDETVGDVLVRLARAGLAGARVLDRNDPLRIAGVVTADDLELAAERGAASAPVGGVLDEPPRAIHAADDAASAIGELARSPSRSAVVLDAGERVIGVVTPAEIRRAVALGKLRDRGARAPAGPR